MNRNTKREVYGLTVDESAPEKQPVMIRFGKHKGKQLMYVLTSYPGWFHYIKNNGEFEGFYGFYRLMDEGVAIYNKAPFSKASCAGHVSGCKCLRPVTRFSVSKDSFKPTFWCASCDPYQLGATEGDLTILSGYYEILDFIKRNGGNAPEQRDAIRRITVAKGFKWWEHSTLDEVEEKKEDEDEFF